MGLVSNVIAKVRLEYPDSASRWSDTFLQKLVHAADCAIREEAEIDWSQTDITLLDGAIYYALPEAAIYVDKVLMGLDGSTFDDGYLETTYYDRLDSLSPTWQDDGGTQPRHYWLLSTPGVPGFSKIGVYPKINSVTSEKIRVIYLACKPNNDAAFGTVASDPNEWIEDMAYVPYVLCHLYAELDPKLSQEYWAMFRSSLPKIRARVQRRQIEWPDAMRSGGPSHTDRYI